MESSISDLPEDMLFLILECLHVKPLLRFKCVSKSWYNLISSPKFVTTHFKKQPNILLVMRSSQRKELVFSFLDLDSPELERVQPDSRISVGINANFNFKIIGQYYGIVFLACDLDVFVCNPVSGEIRCLPRCPFSSNHNTQWGFANDANGFTIVQLQYYNESRPIRIHSIINDYMSIIKAYMYDSATNSWRESGQTYEMSANLRLQDCDVFFNGACHWPFTAWGRRRGVLTMDVSSSVFGVLECPNWSVEQGNESWLKVLDDSLAMVMFHECRSARVVELWVMKEYGVKESWTKQFAMGLVRVVAPLLLLKNDRVLMEHTHNELTSYQFYEKEIKLQPRVKEMKKRHGVRGIRNSFQAIVYKENLFNFN